MPNNRRSDCPLSCFLDQWGDKWTFIVLRDLLAGPKKFSGFLESGEPLPTNLLSSRLLGLVEGGYVVKTQYQEKPKRFEYSITDKGAGLAPIMSVMVDWAVANIDDVGDVPAGLGDGAKPAKAKPKAKAAKVDPPISQGAFDF